VATTYFAYEIKDYSIKCLVRLSYKGVIKTERKVAKKATVTALSNSQLKCFMLAKYLH
jgi:hypothetical protein